MSDVLDDKQAARVHERLTSSFDRDEPIHINHLHGSETLLHSHRALSIQLAAKTEQLADAERLLEKGRSFPGLCTGEIDAYFAKYPREESATVSQFEKTRRCLKAAESILRNAERGEDVQTEAEGFFAKYGSENDG